MPPRTHPRSRRLAAHDRGTQSSDETAAPWRGRKRVADPRQRFIAFDAQTTNTCVSTWRRPWRSRRRFFAQRCRRRCRPVRAAAAHREGGIGKAFGWLASLAPTSTSLHMLHRSRVPALLGSSPSVARSATAGGANEGARPWSLRPRPALARGAWPYISPAPIPTRP